MKKILSLLVIILLAMTSCTSSQIDNSQKVTLKDLKLEVESDKLNKTTTLKTPIFKQTGIYIGTIKYFLRAFIKDKKLFGLQIFGTFETYNWDFLNHATDEKGKKFKITVINKKLAHYSQFTSSTQERVIIDINTAYLKSISKTGIKIKFYGKNGNASVSIRKEPAQLILAELEKRNLTL